MRVGWISSTKEIDKEQHVLPGNNSLVFSCYGMKATRRRGCSSLRSSVMDAARRDPEGGSRRKDICVSGMQHRIAIVVPLNARGFMKKAISIGAALGLCCPMQTPGMGVEISSLLQAAPADSILYVPGSTAKVCQFTGQTDKEFNQPAVSQTEKRFGLVGTDRGYSFEHNGIIFFLFGDSPPTATFNGQPNAQTDTPRVADDNDASVRHGPGSPESANVADRPRVCPPGQRARGQRAPIRA